MTLHDFLELWPIFLGITAGVSGIAIWMFRAAWAASTVRSDVNELQKKVTELFKFHNERKS